MGYCVIAKDSKGKYKAENGEFDDYPKARDFKATIDCERCPMIVQATKLEHALLINNQ